MDSVPRIRSLLSVVRSHIFDACYVIDGEAVRLGAAVTDHLFVHDLGEEGIEVVFTRLAYLNRHLVGEGVCARADVVGQGGEVFLKASVFSDGLDLFVIEVVAFRPLNAHSSISVTPLPMVTVFSFLLCRKALLPI